MVEKLGIIAGGGHLPKQLIDHCHQEGRPFALVCLKDSALPETIGNEQCLWIRLGEAGKAISFFKKEGVREIVMIGGVKRPSLFHLRPDWWTAKFLVKIGFKAFGDDNLLTSVINYIETEGFKIIGIHDVMGNILAGEGVLGKYRPDKQALDDIDHGLKIALGLGALDVGQSVVVQQGIVLGVEAVEGTDELIKRCKNLARSGVGGVLIKTKKPNQEQRADLPTIGVQTVINAYESGLRGIAVQSGKTLIVDQDSVVKKADELGIKLTRENFAEAGKNIKYFPGVEGWFDRINEYGKKLDLDVEHYIISAGYEEILYGCKIKKHFKDIFGCCYVFNEIGKPIWPARVINYSTKTQYLSKINKGLGKLEDRAVNEFMPDDKRRIPFTRMIYFGDGNTDIPSMKLTKERKGNAIAVYNPNGSNKKIALKLLKDGRVNFALPADYREDKQIDKVVKTILDKLAKERDLDVLKAKEEKKKLLAE